MDHTSKNWERVFYFQYKVTIGQCGFEEYFGHDNYGNSGYGD